MFYINMFHIILRHPGQFNKKPTEYEVFWQNEYESGHLAEDCKAEVLILCVLQRFVYNDNCELFCAVLCNWRLLVFSAILLIR